MPREAKPNAKSSTTRSDDLGVITGMGPSLERWFRASFGVKTIADLAALSVRSVRALAKQERRRISAGELGAVIAKARRYIRKSEPDPGKRGPSMAIRRRADADAHKTDGEWEELAQFIVYFERKLQGGIEEQRTKVVERTGVHHMETGDESQWPGIAPQSACDWMVRRLPQIENPVPPVGPAPTIETVQTIQPARTAASGRTGTTQHLAGDVAIRSEGRRSVVFIDLHSVQLYQPVRSAVGQALVSGDAVQSSFVVANQPFALETAFSIRDPDALGSGGRPIPCAVEIRASTAGGGADHSIGSATGEADLETGGTVRVVVGGLAAGEYRLAVRVSLQEGYTGSGVLEVPFLRVV